MSRITAVVADDHLVYRQGLVRLLERSGIEVVGEAPNGDAAIELARDRRPDVVVMDLNMPGTSGLEATRRLLAAETPMRVLVLTVSTQSDDVEAALHSGAVGYVLKDSPIEELVAAIRAAMAAPPPARSVPARATHPRESRRRGARRRFRRLLEPPR